MEDDSPHLPVDRGLPWVKVHSRAAVGQGSFTHEGDREEPRGVHVITPTFLCAWRPAIDFPRSFPRL
jgi:hypothetical protein